MVTPHAPTIARAKLLQFLYFVGLGAGAPFMTLYFKYMLRSPDGQPATYLIGILFFVQSIVVIVSSPAAGILGDLFHAHHRVISLYALMVTVGSFIMAIPGLPGISVNLPTAFLLMLAGITLNGLFNRPLVPLIDTETLHALYSYRGNADDFGEVRQFGSYAWVLSVSVFGFILWQTESLYLSITGSGLIYLVLAFIAWNAEHTRPHKIRLPWEYLRNDAVYRKFLIFAFLIAFPSTGSYQYTGYYMDDLHLDFLLIGLAFGLASLPEIPIFAKSSLLIKKLGSRGMILIGSLILALKLLGFYLLPPSAPPLYFMAIHFIHGFGWAFLYTGMVRFIDSLAHPDLRGTYQNLYQIPWNLASALSGLVSAWMIEVMGSRLMMGVHAATIVAATLYFFVFVRKVPTRS